MTSVLQPMSGAVRAAFREQYLTHLRQRDGMPDLTTRRFDIRERFFQAIDDDPVLWQGALPVDPGVFARNHVRSRPEDGLDSATLWALATAKINRAERFGVELKMAHDEGGEPDCDDPITFIQVEETYHTRILEDALRTIGLSMTVAEPEPRTQMMIRGMVYLPDAVAHIGVLCGEIFGVVAFALLLEKARELFKAQPAVVARMEVLFAQILVDEVGHVQFVRSTLGTGSMALARLLLPVVVRTTLRDMPELEQLFGREVIMRRVLAADVEREAAAYPDRFTFSMGM